MGRRWSPKPIDRTNYEFSDAVILECLKKARFRCEMCGRSKSELKRDGERAYFEIHHILPIAAAIRYFPELLPETIKSLENSFCACHSCHIKIHSEGINEFKEADRLLELQRKRANV